MTTYTELSNYLGNKSDRPWGNHTRAQRDPRYPGSVIIRFWDTIIAELTPAGDIALNSGGYRTQTTKERLNKVLPRPWSIYQAAGVWYLRNYESQAEYIFQDGITLSPDGSVINAAPDTRKADKKLLESIKKYAREYTEALLDGKVDAPNSGDCWGCYFHSEGSDNPLGTDHLLQHIDEKYYPGSLLYKAIEKVRVCDFTKGSIGQLWAGDPISDWQQDITRRDVYNSLYKYIKVNLTSLAC